MDNAPQLASNAALHAIMRLKAGLSPSNCLELLTVDFPRQRSFIKQFLENTSPNIDAVVGPYGAGKSHFLQLAKNQALKAGYLVASLGQETGLGTLSYPHRHIQLMIGGLQAEEPFGRLIDHVASEIEADPLAFLSTACAVMPKALAYRALLGELTLTLKYGSEAQRTTRAVELLSGATIAGQAGSAKSRMRAYELLDFWLAYGREILNRRGLVIIVDELEGLFSGALYWSIRSRRTAYRTLSYYSGIGNHVRILTALTPDGWSRLQDDMYNNAAYISDPVSNVDGEDVPGLLRKLRQVHPHELRSMTDPKYKVLLQNIKTLHAVARGYAPPVDGAIQIATGAGMTPRVFSRSAVSALEALWFHERADGVSA